MNSDSKKRETRDPVEDGAAEDVGRAVWDPEFRAALKRRLARDSEGQNRKLLRTGRRHPRLSSGDDST